MLLDAAMQRPFPFLLTLGALCVGPLLTSTAVHAEQAASRQQPIIYGADDRLDVYQVDDPVFRERAESSVVALMFPRRLAYGSGATVTLESPTEIEVYGLCSDEPFLDQPAAAWCTGTLIDDDLLLTAGHCLGASAEEPELTCRETAFVFRYLYEAEGELATITEDDVFRCRRVVAWNFDERNLNAPDYGILQLDRAATPRHAVAPFRDERITEGEAVTLIGFGARLPAKVDSGGTVVDTGTYANFFGATTDTFEGASGSPLFDNAGELVGVHSRGNADWDTSGSCRASRRQSDGFDEHQHADTVLSQLCATGWPSARLCNRDSECGDSVCSVGETPADCPNDCDDARCGDGVCDASEVRSCESDCNPYADVPIGWHCPPYFYGDRLGCDCSCGALDSDCADPDQELLGCGAGQTCGASGQCVDPASLPEEGCTLRIAPRGRPSGPLLALASLLLVVGWKRRYPSAVGRARRR